jgi:hypothetical protein
MARVIDAETMRDHLGDIIEQAGNRGDEFLVRREGQPLVAIIPYEVYEQLRRQREADFQVFHDVWEANRGVDPEQVAAEVAEAVAEVRAAKRKRSGS